MRMGWSFLAAVLCAILVGATAVSAQSERGGPLELSVTLSGEYTDNRDATVEDAAEENIDLFVKPRIGALFDWERTMLNLYYMLSYRYRTEPAPFQDESQLLHDLGLDFKHDLGNGFKVRAGDTFRVTDDPSGAQLDDRRVASDFTVNDARAGVSYDFSRTTMLDIEANNRMKRYSEDLYSLLNEDSTEGRLMLWRQTAPKFGVFGEVSMQDFGYETTDETTGLEVPDRSFQAMYGGVGAEGDAGGNCRVRGRAGYKMLSFEDESLDDQSSAYVQGSVDFHNTAQSTELRLQATYQVRDSDVVPFAYQKETDLYARLKVKATDSLSVQVSGSYRMGKYEADGLPAAYAGTPDGNEDRLSGEARLTYRFGTKTTVELAQRYEDVSTDVAASADYTRNATILALTQTF